MGLSARNMDRISEALKTLDEMATQEKSEVKEMLSNQFGNLKRTLLDIEPDVRGTIQTASEKISRFASEATDSTKEKLREIGQKVDEQVHDRPWTFMAVTSLAALAAGFYLGSRKRK